MCYWNLQSLDIKIDPIVDWPLFRFSRVFWKFNFAKSNVESSLPNSTKKYTHLAFATFISNLLPHFITQTTALIMKKHNVIYLQFFALRSFWFLHSPMWFTKCFYLTLLSSERKIILWQFFELFGKFSSIPEGVHPNSHVFYLKILSCKIMNFSNPQIYCCKLH